MKELEFHAPREDAGTRVDLKASELSGMSRSRIQRLIEEGFLTVNRCRTKANYRLRYGDSIVIDIPEAEAEEGLIPEDIPVEILHRDEHLVVVNKPAGMVVYPAAGHRSGTLMNALSYHAGRLASIGGPLRPGVVHRLDKDTSGVMVIARDAPSYYDLVRQFRERTIERKYVALVFGSLRGERGEISVPIGRSEVQRKKMSTKTKRGKQALTAWRVLERLPASTLIEAKLGTGRTHQIRVHFASLGHPVLGDRTYGRKVRLLFDKTDISFPRQMLHAELLGFVHPATGNHMEFRSTMPPDMLERIEILRTGK